MVKFVGHLDTNSNKKKGKNKMLTIMRIFVLVILFFDTTSLTNAAEFTNAQRQEMGSIIKDYLLSHPEILQDVSKLLEEKQKQVEGNARKDSIVKNADKIFHNTSDFVAGNPKGDVTIVEFFDYNCPWCKKSFPGVMSLIETDKKVRLVLKEFPILGPDSEYASQAAIAAGGQGKYLEMHKAMYQHQGHMTKEAVDEVAVSLGLDMAKLKKAMEETATMEVINKNRDLGQTLSISGTPAFVIGDILVPGYLPADELATAIQEVRQTGGCAIC